MFYLGTSPREPDIEAMLNAHRLGLMCQPASNPPRAGWVWAADNGCFAAKWDPKRWQAWLSRPMPRSGCLFAVVPDVVADHAATLERWDVYGDVVRRLRYPAAFVAQNGAEDGGVPWDDLDCLFIGGSTEWKQSEHAFTLAVEARRRGKWVVHVGRVNSSARLASWRAHADSADGTFLAFGPKVNLPKVIGWLEHAEANASLFAV